jgi:hypothetical protein
VRSPILEVRVSELWDREIFASWAGPVCEWHGATFTGPKPNPFHLLLPAFRLIGRHPLDLPSTVTIETEIPKD